MNECVVMSLNLKCERAVLCVCVCVSQDTCQRDVSFCHPVNVLRLAIAALW